MIEPRDKQLPRGYHQHAAPVAFNRFAHRRGEPVEADAVRNRIFGGDGKFVQLVIGEGRFFLDAELMRIRLCFGMGSHGVLVFIQRFKKFCIMRKPVA